METLRYCSREHQAIDWTTSHKLDCGKVDANKVATSPANPANTFLFKEYGICLDNVYLSLSCYM